MTINNELALKRTNYELNQELLHYFLKYLLEATDRSEKTILNIKRDIEAFLLSLFENNDAMIQYKNIVQYLDYIEEKYKESSFISKASSLRQFINWLNLEENPFWKIKIAVSYEDFKFYTYEDIFTENNPVIASTEGARQSHEFSYSSLIIRTLYELYLSIDELSSLKIADYNLASKQIKIRSKQMQVSEILADALKFYLKQYRPSVEGQVSVSLNDALFLSKSGEPLKTLDIISVLKERDLKNIYLKRSRIIHLMDEAKSQSEIEELLRIKLSSFYAPFIKEKDYRLLSAYNEFHPRGRMSS